MIELTFPGKNIYSGKDLGVRAKRKITRVKILTIVYYSLKELMP